MTNLVCQICNFKAKSRGSLSKHVSYIHKISSLETKKLIFVWFPEIFISCINCGIKILKYPNEGGSCCCSKECAKEVLLKKNKGRKQTKEVIEKRIKNTDQFKKEAKRVETNLNRYGFCNHSQLQESRSNISKKHKGSKKPKNIELDTIMMISIDTIIRIFI